MSEATKKNDVIQIGPSFPNELFRHHFALVDEVRSWGVQAFVKSLGTGGNAYVRIVHSDYERIGEAVWAPQAAPPPVE